MGSVLPFLTARPTVNPTRRGAAPYPGEVGEAVTTGLGIGIALFPEAEELDWAGPWEVLSHWVDSCPDDHIRIFTVAQHKGLVTCARGLRVIPEYTWTEAPAIDVLVYPGGRGTRSQIGDDAIALWLRGLAARGTLMTSVCTGALVFGSAGLLNGRPATTHWDALEDLRALGAGQDHHRGRRLGGHRYGASPCGPVALSRPGS
jgi:putative intracellular protease/amidase